LGYIKGIDDNLSDDTNINKKWYASLMLNRLMFCYFIQKRKFLNWDDKYLTNKLAECKKHAGKNSFYGFYRSFLLELFHNELAYPEEKRKKRMSPVSFGTIPYLNGGLFDVHELEKNYTDITIKDQAFDKIFALFDQYEWHLDTRQQSSGREVNPDVIGYIFEKYINDRASMGAYYTKEDITDYIGKNTIIPFILDKVKSWYKEPFENGGAFWQYLQTSDGDYIYDSVKQGIPENAKNINELDIPVNIKIGIDTKKPNLLERRKDWNTSTAAEFALPAEIWRETISRFERYFEVKNKIASGGIQQVNDLITYNLNIKKLLSDFLEQTQDAKFIRTLYKVLPTVTILDPTCGSGAFLFAAMNILEPLYEICINRMEEMYNANPSKNNDFRQRLEDIYTGNHPNLKYYIYKTIILNNLYGVDIMNEAVEIAKLRLFLKLVAEVDPSKGKKNYGLEPLPDIDFNIRSGNTLVGFATEAQLEEVVRNTEGDLIYKEKLEELKLACKSAALSFDHFQKQQIISVINSTKYKEIKKSLTNDLKILDEKLNRYLADTYGLGTKTQWKSAKEKEASYTAWKKSHQPFHWFAEFYEIIDKGGFDVVIGNPPYVEKRTINYSLKNYITEETNNLYSYCLERSYSLLVKNGLTGFIIPISSYSTDKFIKLKNITLQQGVIWISNYDDRPARLFEGLEHIQLSIVIAKNYKLNDKEVYTTNSKKWQSIERSFVFEYLFYNKVLNKNHIEGSIQKFGDCKEVNILEKIFSNNKIFNYMVESNYNIYYTRKVHAFLNILDFVPKIKDSTGKIRNPSEQKIISFENLNYKNIALSAYNSTLFRWFLSVFSDIRNLNKREISLFPISLNSFSSKNELDLNKLSNKLMANVIKTSEVRQMKFGGETLSVQCIIPRYSKKIIDEIDKVLAKHYGFTEEELDFIINYDIKYRMGGELEGEE
jgi:hypothetical protein